MDYKRTSDADLLREYREKRNQLALDEFVGRHRATILAACRAIPGGSHYAEDACHETFVKVISNPGLIEGWDNPLGWLCRVAQNKVREMLRMAARRRRYESAGAGKNPSYTREQWPEDCLGIINEEIARLPPMQREVFSRRADGVSSEEIAAALGTTPESVYSLFRRARNTLQPRLIRRGVPPAVVLLVAGAPTAANGVAAAGRGLALFARDAAAAGGAGRVSWYAGGLLVVAGAVAGVVVASVAPPTPDAPPAPPARTVSERLALALTPLATERVLNVTRDGNATGGIYFSPKGDLVAVRGEGRVPGDVAGETRTEPMVMVFKTDTGAPCCTKLGFDVPESNRAGQIFSPDGKHLALIDHRSGKVVLCDPLHGDIRKQFEHRNARGVLFADRGNTLLTIKHDCSGFPSPSRPAFQPEVTAWDVNTQQMRSTHRNLPSDRWLQPMFGTSAMGVSSGDAVMKLLTLDSDPGHRRLDGVDQRDKILDTAANGSMLARKDRDLVVIEPSGATKVLFGRTAEEAYTVGCLSAAGDLVVGMSHCTLRVIRAADATCLAEVPLVGPGAKKRYVIPMDVSVSADKGYIVAHWVDYSVDLREDGTADGEMIPVLTARVFDLRGRVVWEKEGVQVAIDPLHRHAVVTTIPGLGSGRRRAADSDPGGSSSVASVTIQDASAWLPPRRW